jgi:hypothetical protein
MHQTLISVSILYIKTNWINLWSSKLLNRTPVGLPELSNCRYPEPEQFNQHDHILSLQDPYQYYSPITYMHSSSSIHATCPTHLIHLDFIILIILGKEYTIMNLLLLQFSAPSCHFSRIQFKYIPQHTFGLCSSFNISDKVSHPYRTIGNIILIVSYILIHMFLMADEETQNFRLHGSKHYENSISSYLPSESNFDFIIIIIIFISIKSNTVQDVEKSIYKMSSTTVLSQNVYNSKIMASK